MGNQVVTMESFQQFLETKEYNPRVTKARITALKDKYQNDRYLRRVDFQCPGLTQKGEQCKNPTWCKIKHHRWLQTEVCYKEAVIERMYNDIEDTITSDDIFEYIPDGVDTELTLALENENIKIIKLERNPLANQ